MSDLLESYGDQRLIEEITKVNPSYKLSTAVRTKLMREILNHKSSAANRCTSANTVDVASVTPKQFDEDVIRSAISSRFVDL